jgi:hypothetical protein
MAVAVGVAVALTVVAGTILAALAAIVVAAALFTAVIIAAAIIAIVARVALVALLATLIAVLTGGAVGLDEIVVLEIGTRNARRLLAGIILFEARAALAQHAEIMVGELQIIFGVDPVALHLRVAREILVFLEQLRGIATGPVVDAVAVIALIPATAGTLLLLTATAATAAVCLTIVHQGLSVLSLLSCPSVHLGPGCSLHWRLRHRWRIPRAMATGLQRLT